MQVIKFVTISFGAQKDVTLYYSQFNVVRIMKKRNEESKLSLDKETIARLNEEQLSIEQTNALEGGATGGGNTDPSCCGIGKTGTYTSCPA